MFPRNVSRHLEVKLKFLLEIILISGLLRRIRREEDKNLRWINDDEVFESMLIAIGRNNMYKF